MDIEIGDCVLTEVTIAEISDTFFPIWLAFELTDINGDNHAFEEKSPLILSDSDTLPSSFPAKSKLACTVTKYFPTHAEIDTSEPHGVHASDGTSQFEVALRMFIPTGLPHKNQ